MLAACGGAPASEGPFLIELFVSPTPPTTEAGALLIMITDSVGAPVGGATVTVTAESAGEPAVEAAAVEKSPGRYGIDAFGFSASGDWIISADVTTELGATGRRSFPVHVVPSGD